MYAQRSNNHPKSPAHPADFNTWAMFDVSGLPSENVGCQESRGSRNFHANEAGPSELTTAYLAARPRNRFVRISDKITALAYR